MQNDKSKSKREFIARLIRFTVRTLRFTARIRKDANLWEVASQLVRSAASVGANVVEAQAGSSRKDYTKFFEIALKSANETKYWLVVVREYDTQYGEETKHLLAEAEEIANMLGSSVLKLKGKR